MIQGICGRTFIASSVPPGPLQSWESRLRDRLAAIGSTESALIWREAAMPDGPSISRLAPSTVHSNGSASTGSRWPTPQARDHMPPHTPEYIAEKKAQGHGMANLNDYMALTARWSTPRASDGEKGGPNQSFGAGGQPLPSQMYQVSRWRGPTAGERRGGAYSDPEKALARINSGHTVNLEDQMVVGGQTLSGSPATTGSSGAPNPAFPFWLMGFPDVWVSGASQAMRSRRSSRRK